MNYAYLRYVGRIVRGNYRPRFQKRSVILKLGQALSESSQDEGLTYPEATEVLIEQGQNISVNNVWCAYRRYYEMTGLPVPERHYNNGRPRKPR